MSYLFDFHVFYQERERRSYSSSPLKQQKKWLNSGMLS